MSGKVYRISARVSGGASGTLPTYETSVTSALVKVEQGLSFPQFVFGGRGGVGGAEYALFKRDTSYGFHIFRTATETRFKEGDIVEIKFGLASPLINDMEIVCKLYFDNESSTSTSNAINGFNYATNTQIVTLTSKNFANSVHFKNNFFIEFQIKGTDLATILLPITYSVETKDT